MDVFPSYMRNHSVDSELLAGLAMNATSLRSDFMRNFMDPRRDVDDECGYPSNAASIPSTFYRDLYEREPVAARIVQLMPKECWQKTPLVYETEDSGDVTPFEEAWDNLGKSLRGEQCWYQDEEGSPVWEYLRRADVLSGVGSFGVILLGLDDGRMLDQPADGAVSMSPDGRPMVGNTYEVPGVEAQDRVVYERNMAPAVMNGNPKWDGTWNVRREAYVNVQVANKVAPSQGGHTFSSGDRGAATPRKPQTQWDDDGTTNELPASITESSDWGTSHNPKQPTKSKAVKADGTSPFQETADYGKVGTDAQYAGVQMGPPQFPAADPSNDEHKLLFMRVFDESLVQIVQYEANVANPRFGKPIMYRITLNDPRDQQSGIGLPMATVRVHWSRIIHLNDSSSNPSSSEIFSPPRMRPVLNNVLALRKLYGGSAEGYWKSGCMPIYSLETVPQLGGDVRVDYAQVKDQMEQMMNGLQKWGAFMGLQMKSIGPQIVDPTPQINVQLEAICIQLGCPVRVFKGSERGELASSQDDSSWNDRLRERQLNYLTPKVIVPFIDRLIQLGVLPAPTKSKKEDGDVSKKPGDANGAGGDASGKSDDGRSDAVSKDNDGSGSSVDKSAKPNPKPNPVANTYIRNADGKVTGVNTSAGYSIEWPDLDSLGDKDKAAIALQETQALAAFIAGGCESGMSLKSFYVHLLRWTEEQADAVIAEAKEVHDSMDTMTAPPMIQGQPAKAPPGTQADSDQKAAKDAAAKQADAAAKMPQAPVVVPPGGKAVHPADVQPAKPPAVAQKNGQAGAKAP